MRYVGVTLAFLLIPCVPVGASKSDDPGAFVDALWCVQRHGTAEALDPRNDQRIKGALSRALLGDGSLSEGEVKGMIDPLRFARLAGADRRLDANEIRHALAADVPASRRRLLPRVAAHADYLTTTFDMIDERHLDPCDRLVEWIVAHYKPGEPLDLIVICTGNSRRSILGAMLGNIAAAYYGPAEVRFQSGGTTPSACNARTVAALGEIGVEVEPTGKEAPRGEPRTANPIYRMRWGTSAEGDGIALEALEFSKRYDDAVNPHSGFAAILVCGEADAACPVVRGASTRIAMPYLDPKIYDGSPYEARKYAERRDDMGRFMLSVLMRVRNRLDARP